MRTFLFLILAAVSAFGANTVTYDTNTLFITSSNILSSNIIASANIGYTKGANGQLTLTLSNSITATNFNVGNSTATNGYTTLFSTQLVATNSTANSNLTLNVDVACQDIFITNNISVTNFANLTAGTDKDVELHFYPQLVNRTVVWPTPGSPGNGVFWRTNANFPMWTTLTQGVCIRAEIKVRNTNFWVRLSEWK